MPEDLEAVHLGHLDVKEHDGRRAGFAAGEPAAGMKVVEGLDAVARHDDFVGDMGFGQGGGGEFDVGQVVLDEEDAFQGFHDVAGVGGREK